eukprot:scaffold3354_cov369-Prasinococcus_capsulatus_cf.AAC.1
MRRHTPREAPSAPVAEPKRQPGDDAFPQGPRALNKWRTRLRLRSITLAVATGCMVGLWAALGAMRAVSPNSSGSPRRDDLGANSTRDAAHCVFSEQGPSPPVSATPGEHGIPKVIHQTHKSIESLPGDIREWMASWRRLNPSWQTRYGHGSVGELASPASPQRSTRVAVDGKA